MNEGSDQHEVMPCSITNREPLAEVSGPCRCRTGHSSTARLEAPHEDAISTSMEGSEAVVSPHLGRLWCRQPRNSRHACNLSVLQAAKWLFYRQEVVVAE